MRMLRFNAWSKTIAFACTVLLFVGLGIARSRGWRNDDDDDRGHDKKSPTPPGLFITPTALDEAVQQDLKPALGLSYFATNYPNFVAGQAVKAVVSPDGTTLAILTAGMNSLYYPNNCEPPAAPPLGSNGCLAGIVDKAASTQFLFVYDIAGANKKKPVLKQVIQQLNAHVGLVWAPNSQTLYAAGGCDDAVYAYTKSGSSFAPGATISLGHAPNGCVSNAANRTGLGLSVEPNVAGLAISADGGTLVAVNNYNDSISIINTATKTVVPPDIDLRPFASGAPNGTKGGTFPYSVVLNGNIAYVGCDRDREVVAVNLSTKKVVARISTDGRDRGNVCSLSQVPIPEGRSRR